VGVGIDFIQETGPSGSAGALGVVWKPLIIFLAFGMADQGALVALGRAAPFSLSNLRGVKNPATAVCWVRKGAFSCRRDYHDRKFICI
jgi:hypothetical protein